MNAELQKYKRYRSTGVPWIGEVPDHWEMERAKWLYQKMTRPARGSDEIVTCFRDGIVTLRKNRRLDGFTNSLKEIGYQGVRRGDLVIHAMDAFAGAVGVSDSDGKSTPVYSVCTPRRELDNRYYAYLIREMARSQWIMCLARGIRERSTDFRFQTFGAQTVPLPPVEEQRAIADYLDANALKVHRFIHNRRRLIEGLNEQKQAIINRAVMRGIDPNVPFKPSGLDWFGDIPKHWDLRRIRTLVVRIDQGVSPQAENLLAKDGSYGVLKSGCVNHGVFRPEQHKRLPDDYQFDRKIEVSSGDILVSRACGSPHLVGSVGKVTKSPYKLILSDKTFRLIFQSSEHVGFFLYAMNSVIYRRQVRLAISGVEGLANNLPLSSLRNFVIPFPPADEAQRIADVVRMECNDAFRGINLAQREINLIREYRTRLISDVVTGKIDVRHLAPHPGDEDLEESSKVLEPLEDVMADIEMDDKEDFNESD
jgi:type I restriction enzyme S subunit